MGKKYQEQIPYELTNTISGHYANKAKENISNKGFYALFTIFVIIIISIVLLIVYLFGERNTVAPLSHDPPVLESKKPIVSIPKNRGGRTFDNRDKRVFGVFGDKAAPPADTEKLRPPPEEPIFLVPPKITEAKTETADTLTAPESSQTASQDNSQAPKQASEQITALPPPPPKPQTNPPDTTTSPAYYLQLASLKSHAQAQQFLKDIQQKFPSLLKQIPTHIKKVNITNQGDFFRATIGAFSQKNEAETLCHQLKTLKQNCLVKKTTPNTE